MPTLELRIWSTSCVSGFQLFEETVDYKIQEHQQRAELATEDGNSFPWSRVVTLSVRF